MTINTVSPIASALLEAHVAYLLRQLNDENFASVLATTLETLLAEASKLTLLEVVSPDAIKETVYRYALELELGAGILELVAAIARDLYAHPIHQQTQLYQLMSDKQLGQMLDKALEMKPLRDRLMHEFVVNPVYVSLASDLLYHGIQGYLAQIADTGRLVGVGSVLKLGKSVWRSVPFGIEESLESHLRRYIRKSISRLVEESESFLLRLDEDNLREAVLDIWDSIKHHHAGLLHELLTSLDVEEWFVLSYEFWREFRQTDYCRALLDSGIDTFFRQYGDTGLRDLLAEIGVTPEMMLADALRFAPPVIQVLNEKNILAALLRQQLSPFYQSPEVSAILSGALP